MSELHQLWQLPEPTTTAAFNRKLAKKLVGKHVGIIFCYLNKSGSIKKQEQRHGMVLLVDQKQGVTIRDLVSDEVIYLPPDLRSWRKSFKDEKNIHASDIFLGSIEYVSAWLIPFGGQQARPISESFTAPKSGFYHIYGCGTKLYGRADKLADGSYIATKWITALGFPIYPIASFRLRNRQTSVSFGIGPSVSYLSEPVFLHVPQVLMTYTISIPLLALFIWISYRILV